MYLRRFCGTNDHGYVPFVVSTNRSFPHSWLLKGFVTNSTTVPHVEQDLLTLPEHMNSLPVFIGVRVARSLVCCVMFCRSLFVPLSCFFWSLCSLCFYLRILVTPPLVSSNFSYLICICAIVILVYENNDIWHILSLQK